MQGVVQKGTRPVVQHDSSVCEQIYYKQYASSPWLKGHSFMIINRMCFIIVKGHWFICATWLIHLWHDSFIYMHRRKRDSWRTGVDTATHCNTLQHAATHYNTLQHTATHCSTLQHTATQAQVWLLKDKCRRANCNTLHHALQHIAMQHSATHCNTLQRTATQCNTGVSVIAWEQVWKGTLQHSALHTATHRTATHCNTMQRTATRCNTLHYTTPQANVWRLDEKCGRAPILVLTKKKQRILYSYEKTRTKDTYIHMKADLSKSLTYLWKETYIHTKGDLQKTPIYTWKQTCQGVRYTMTGS